MIRIPLLRSTAAASALVVLFSLTSALQAQTDVPAAPTQAPTAVIGPNFPKPDPANFTVDSPTQDQVKGFLEASFGYDASRVFQVQAINKTILPGVSKVIILGGEKGKADIGSYEFFVMPDGKHLISGNEILPFSDHPFAENRTALLNLADGPSKGSAKKDLELVEFADFECPHCKDAQPTVDKLLADYPNAHFVYESLPLVRIHKHAFRAAAYGYCVAKLAGNPAFFDFAGAVFDGQQGLATDEGATLTLNSAVSKANQDPVKVEACSQTPETKAAVESVLKLATDLNVSQTPFLFINGRGVPLNQVPYETLKQIIDYSVANDGPAK